MRTLFWIKVASVGLLSGLVGILLTWGGQHLVADHRALHDLITVTNYNLQTRTLALPTVAPAPQPQPPAPPTSPKP